MRAYARAIAMVLIVILVLLLTREADALTLEEGATYFEDGTCMEADGAPGMAGADGQCITTADYDIIFSYEVLDEIPASSDPTVSLAVALDLDPDVPASLRHVNLGPSGKPYTFRELANGLVMM